MTKKIDKILEVLPDIIKNSAGLFIKNLDENGKDIVDHSSGTIGILLKLFGKPIIDKIYENRSNNKLSNFGTEIYLEAAQRQVAESIQLIQDEVNSKYTANQIVEILSEISTINTRNINPENLIVVFQPQYHPAVEFVKENQTRLLEKLEIKASSIDTFIKDFNKGIKKKVELTFGEDYKKHLLEIEEFICEEAESKLLVETIKAAKIGFDTSEDLLYEETFAEYKPVSEFNYVEEKLNNRNSERELKPITSLIDNYFAVDGESIEKLLFIIADFGKGKSVFMKHFAAQLAKKYIQTGEGYLPVYFNLREYNEYKSDEKFGVIAKFLSKKFAFEIELNKSKKYFFLIDSLDESGELTQHSIDEVISSIEKIQDIDRQHCRDNRIIITSRPIHEGLISHMCRHNPHFEKNKEGRDIPHFISIYGFKKEQFNNWLNYTLSQSGRKPELTDTTLIKNILNDIVSKRKVDIYKELLNEKTLSTSELQRPIFAYMIYQLIIKNVDFLKVGQIGIYLSFINLLSKDAKYINDKNLDIDLLKEFEFRNLLNTTAALWQFERHRNNQGFLNKADICRVLDGENKGDSDKDILIRYKDVSDVQFLSHSYFGENNNTLHFQHQSFAEILLAEYYLKVFICYAFDINPDIYKCREKLLLGIPTLQTKIFFKDLLNLLKETISDTCSDEVLEKRKLLFPLLASLSIQKSNTLFCQELYYKWFETVIIRENEAEYPIQLLENWCLNQKNIDRIIQLSADIINSKDSYILTKAESRINLFEKEVILIRNKSISDLTSDLDKKFALLVGNILCNDFSNIEEPILFNKKHKIDCNILVEMLNSEDRFNWDYFDLFLGIDTSNNEQLSIQISSSLFEINLSYCNFSHTYFISSLGDVNFSYATFMNVDFYVDIASIDFTNSKLIECGFFGTVFDVDFSRCSKLNNIVFSGVYNSVSISSLKYLDKKYLKSISSKGRLFIPQNLNYYKNKSLNKKTKSGDKSRIAVDLKEMNQIISFIRVFGKSYLKNKKTYSVELQNMFIFQDKFVEQLFFKALFGNKRIEDVISDEIALEKN